MASRNTVIRAIAIWADAALLYPELVPEDMQYLERVNAGEGFRIEESAPLSSVLITEGIHLSKQEIEAIVAEVAALHGNKGGMDQ